MKKRIISLVLVLFLSLGLFFFAAPSASAAYDYQPDSSLWGTFRQALSTAVLPFVTFLLPENSWDFTFTKTGSVSSVELNEQLDRYNSFIGSVMRFGSGGGDLCTRAERVYDRNNGIFRLKDSASGAWIVDSRGRFPYFETSVSGDVPASVLAGEAVTPNYPGSPELSKNSSNRWLELSILQPKLQAGTVMGNTTYSYEQLSDLLSALRKVSPSTNYRLATVFGGSYGVCKNNLVLCDSTGAPFIAYKSKDSAAANQTYNYYAPVTNEGDTVDNSVTVNTQIQNTDDYTFNIPLDASTNIGQYIESQYFDFSTQSYTTNTYDITYNNQFNCYETNYYTWNITYNISNTYVTYIGSNDAWQQEEYRFYYELPDGRSSADLTEDEVAALSFQFADCVNYARSATDINLRALYHFDGNTNDSGYFSDKSSFAWTSGASITYMDSSAFNGALYLDETAHGFTIGVPMKRYSRDDFTIQFRYYQASQPDSVDNKENTLKLGDTYLLKWDERTLYNGSGTSLCSLPIGNWAEIALIRSNGTLYTYVNGLKVASQADSNYYLAETLQFTFGSTSRAYSMLDELRVLDFALAASGASYTPTSVPYDTNLVLVLPDSATPILDTYWDFNTEGNYLEGYDFTTGVEALPSTWSGGYNPDYVRILYEQDFVRLISTRSGSGNGFSSSTVSRSDLKNRGLSYSAWAVPKGSGSYVFSIMTADGAVYSLPFTAERYTENTLLVTGNYQDRDYLRLNGESNRTTSRYVSSYLDDLTLVVYAYADNNGNAYKLDLAVIPARGKTLDIVYAEVKQGTEANSGHERVTCAYSSLDLKPNTAAVHTDIPIHGYTVGGVRPTFPVRGDVWFQVSSRRIIGVQVYNGQAWEASNARWWTGSRWIPIYAFDVFTLEDCWDVADTDDVVTQITTEGGFWNWWKGAWIDFRSWLSGVFPGGSDTPDPSPSPSSSPSSSPSPEPDVDNRPLALATGVNIIRENAEHWMANNASSVTIQMEPGDLWARYNTVRNLFTVDLMNGALSDDLIVSLEIDGLPVTESGQWDAASFLLYGDDDNYVSIGKKSHFDGLTTVSEVSGACDELGGDSRDNAVTSATLVLYKSGTSVRTFFKPIDGQWLEGNSLTVDFTVSKVGFACWEYYSRGKSVTFKNLRMSAASRYALVGDISVFLNSFLTCQIVPFFIGGGFLVPGGSLLDPGHSIYVPGGSGRDPSKDDPLSDGDSSFFLWDIINMVIDALWKLVKGLFETVFGGILSFFARILQGMTGFFGAFTGNFGVFGFDTFNPLTGGNIWG